MMTNKKSNVAVKNNAVNYGFRRVVEDKLRKSAVLPSMSFVQAKRYLGTLENEITIERDEYELVQLKTQLREITKIFGLNYEDVLNKIRAARLEKTSLKCDLASVGEYSFLIASQLNCDIDNESKVVIRKQLAEAAFILAV